MSQCISMNQSIPTKILSVLNYGAFISSVRVDYEYQGKRCEFHNYDLVVFQEFRLEIPGDATNIIFRAWATDIFKGQYLVFDIRYQVAEDSSFLLWGLSHSAQFKPIPCAATAVLKNILPPAALVPHDSINNCFSLNSGNLATNYASPAKCLSAPNVNPCCIDNPCCIGNPSCTNKC